MTAAASGDFSIRQHQIEYTQKDAIEFGSMKEAVNKVISQPLTNDQLDSINKALIKAILDKPTHKVLAAKLLILQNDIMELKSTINEKDSSLKDKAINAVKNSLKNLTITADDLLNLKKESILELEKLKEAQSKGKEDQAKTQPQPQQVKSAAAPAEPAKTEKKTVSPDRKKYELDRYKQALAQLKADPNSLKNFRAYLNVVSGLARLYLIENYVPDLVPYNFTSINSYKPEITASDTGDFTIWIDKTTERAKQFGEVNMERVVILPQIQIEFWAKKLLPAAEQDTKLIEAHKKDIAQKPSVDFEDFGKALPESPVEIFNARSPSENAKDDTVPDRFTVMNWISKFGSPELKGRFIVHEDASCRKGEKILSYLDKKTGMFIQEKLKFFPDLGMYFLSQGASWEPTDCATIGQYIAQHSDLNPKGGLTRKEVGL